MRPSLFQNLQNLWAPPIVDLFASRLTFLERPQFVSWSPDSLASYTDAFSLNLSGLRGYAFPPFALIGHCLRQMSIQEVDQLVLVAPVWPTQPWYPLLAVVESLLTGCSCSFLLSRTFSPGKSYALISHPAVRWVGSVSDRYLTTNFSQETSDILLAACRRSTSNAFPLPGTSGKGDVWQTVLIPFQLLKGLSWIFLRTNSMREGSIGP